MSVKNLEPFQRKNETNVVYRQTQYFSPNIIPSLIRGQQQHVPSTYMKIYGLHSKGMDFKRLLETLSTWKMK